MLELLALSPTLQFAWQVLLVAVGIGLVIFVHELGHFLVAKRVGIRVETFSLGFGPRLLGFRRGDTDYRVSMIPLGGYVKMAGENPDDPRAGGEDEYTSKTVGQRAAVISAGVIMNTIFAVVGFFVAFKIGVLMHVPVVGTVVEGAPADGALRRGDRILAVDGKPVLDFKDIGLAAAFADGPLELEIERDGTRMVVSIEPKRGLGEEFQRLGIEPIEEVVEVEPGAAAEKAGLRKGDRILTVDGRLLKGLANLQEIVEASPGKPLALVVARDDAPRRTIALAPDSKPVRSFGIELAPTPVIEAVLDDSPAAEAGLVPGDKILEVEAQPAHIDTLVEKITSGAGRPIRLAVERKGEKLVKELTPRHDPSRGRPMIGIEFRSPIVARVEPGSPAEGAGIKPGDRLEKVRPEGAGDDVSIANQLALRRIANATADERVALSWRTPDGRANEAALAAVVVPGAFYGDVGAAFGPATFTHVAPGVWEPIRLGFDRTIGVVQQIFLMIAGFFQDRISARTLGGPVQIGQAAYHFAGYGVGTLIYFLALLSINLAVLNILPVPILDGGHLVFLLIEKVKGSPVSPTVQGYAQWAGLVLLLALMVFVTKNDIFRLMKPG